MMPLIRFLQAISCRRQNWSRGSYRKSGTEYTSQHADSHTPLSWRRPPPVGDKGATVAPTANWEQSAPRNMPILTRHYLREIIGSDRVMPPFAIDKIPPGHLQEETKEEQGLLSQIGDKIHLATRRFSHAIILEKVIKTLLSKFYSLSQVIYAGCNNGVEESSTRKFNDVGVFN
ncbi:hypothetical protein CDAR_216281 [Caerostris darwini]|uniref:Uncharacterized protein n=1 Tax=Caerostris darwini TaxID=1538125 RepID=A0AAV4SKQ1_9ARAC|nr:hypothetical protein CDAR_216281 [Caerostris darwini]